MSDETDVATPGPAGRKARACRTCATAKAKCVPQEGQIGGPCGRCHRLRKECSGQRASSKHTHRKQTRIEQLEQKIDSLLAAQSWPAPHPPSLAVPPAVPSAVPSAIPPTIPTICLHPPRQTMPAEASISHLIKPDSSADPLKVFHSELAKHCPWVIVPSDTNCAELSQKKPFLFLSICLAASYHDFPGQLELARKIGEYMGLHQFLDKEEKLDLLQGLLVTITWYQYQMALSIQPTNLLHLAIAQVVELSLNRRLHASDRQQHAIGWLRALPSNEDSCRNQPYSLDGPRAYLGCFYFSSLISMCIKKMDPMLWNQQTEECCRLLTERNECPSDTYLVHHVRLHRIACRIGQILPFEELEIHPGASTQAIRMCVKSFQRDLQEFRKSWCVEMADPGWKISLVMHFHIVEMYLHEIGFHISSKGEDSLLRLELLYNCLLSAKAFFNELFSVSATTFTACTYAPWVQLRFALVILFKLSLLEDADWDLSHVRQVLDFVQVLDRVLALNKELEAQVLQPQYAVRNDRFARIASQGARLKEKYISRLALLEAGAGKIIDDLGQVNNGMSDGELFRGLDEAFWQDIIADWNVDAEPRQ